MAELENLHLKPGTEFGSEIPSKNVLSAELNHSDIDLGSGNKTDLFYHWPKSIQSTTFLNVFYVFVGLSVFIIIYFTIKAISMKGEKTKNKQAPSTGTRLRQRKSKVRRYGIVASREDVEMTPLGDEDEDEDSTVFDINDHSRS